MEYSQSDAAGFINIKLVQYSSNLDFISRRATVEIRYTYAYYIRKMRVRGRDGDENGGGDKKSLNNY